ncbi:hypothetical protein XarbCFBP7408_08095 [Xanthomonas arboricola pv. guizotiae]|uniref:Uncharacterized protein n=2 Tax=Xanthomonas arboricola TaxID=56448 RepID=A0A2S6ZWW1_9XANT|nr:hypothetical protein XarbCFBP7409_14670 [Xanthomonas arboricola pv. guizotiae]PPU24564.1 hypothetical protein XarbCFBP7408_08095 [Xanthomonas arboricola pv. guizotiae]
MASPRTRRRAGDDKLRDALAFGITVERVDALEQLLLTSASQGDVVAAGSVDRLELHLARAGKRDLRCGRAAGATRTILDQWALYRR